MSLAILLHFLCAQHVSDINISITRSLRLFCWITTLVVLFLGRCVLEFRCGWFGVVSVLQASMSLAILFHFLCAQHVSDINMSIIRSLRLFCWITTLVILFLVRCVLEFRCGWFGVVSVLQASACYTDTTVRSEKCVVRRFRRCANVIQCTYANLDSTVYPSTHLVYMV